MEKSKFFFIAPAVIVGSAGNAFAANYTPVNDNHRPQTAGNEIHSQDEWLNRVIIYYYSQLEKNIHNLTGENSLKNYEIDLLKQQSLRMRVEDMFKQIERICSEYTLPLQTGKMTFPLDKKDFNPYIFPITSFYGPRNNVFHGGSYLHRAIDIMAPGGAAVLSPMPGYIVYSERESAANIYTVVIYHGRGIYSRWAHVHPVKKDGFVEAGQMFARVMHRSRYSTGPHSHMEIIRRIGKEFYTINIHSVQQYFSFSFMKNGERVLKEEQYLDNARMRASYKKFITHARKIYKLNFKKDYSEFDKQTLPYLMQEMNKLVVNEAELDKNIIAGLKQAIINEVIHQLREKYSEIHHTPSFLKHFASSLHQIIELRMDAKGGIHYRKNNVGKHFSSILNRFYPELVYENFKTYFTSLNLEIFTHIIDKVSIKNFEMNDPLLQNDFLKRILHYDKRLRNMLWEKYRKFSIHFFEHIRKVFFLNLELPEQIKTFEDFLQYYQKQLRNFGTNPVPLNTIHAKLASLDLKLLLLQKNKSRFFHSIVKHPEFENLVSFTQSDFNEYMRSCFNEYLQSFRDGKNAEETDDFHPEQIRQKDKTRMNLLKGYPQDELFKPFVQVKEYKDRISIFFESPGHYFGQKIFGVKLVVNQSENALLLIEQKKRGGNNYRIMARFKPLYVSEFGTQGFYFEIFKHEKILYLKSCSPHSHVKQYYKLQDLKSLHLNITVHPVNLDNDKDDVVKTLLRPFEYSVPIALPNISPIIQNV